MCFALRIFDFRRGLPSHLMQTTLFILTLFALGSKTENITRSTMESKTVNITRTTIESKIANSTSSLPYHPLIGTAVPVVEKLNDINIVRDLLST